jgi:hypothetical protein
MTSFIIGLFVGSFIGVAIMALLAMARDPEPPKHEARKVLTDLAEAIDKENLYFEFPRSLNQDTLERKRDARTKRKGGS